MEGDINDNDKRNADTKEKILNTDGIDKKLDEKDILPIEQKKHQNEQQENTANMNMNLDNKMDVEEE